MKKRGGQAERRRPRHALSRGQRVYYAGPNLNYASPESQRKSAVDTAAGCRRLRSSCARRRHGAKPLFIGSEGKLSRLRDMQQLNLIVPLVGNFAGDKALVSVGNYLRAGNETVSAF